MPMPRRLLAMTAAALALAALSSGARAANEGPYGTRLALALQCSLHWTHACDLAYGVSPDAAKRAAITPNGEGLPLPWPFPWRKIVMPVEG